MPTVEITLPEELAAEFQRLIDQEFVTRDEAVERLVRAGVETYTREFEEVEAPDLSEEYAADIWHTAGEGMDDGTDR